MSRILIIGDSCGEGEWSYLCSKHRVSRSICKCHHSIESYYGVIHRGLEKYLLDHGCYVKNLSMGGISNAYCLSMLTHIVELKTFDYIFWFVTDPLRDINLKPNYPLVARDGSEMEAVIDHLMLKSLDVANRIVQHVENGIHIIGGFYSPKLEHLEQYDHIHIACHSFLDLLSTKPLPDDYHGYSALPKIHDTTHWKLEDGAIDYVESSYKTFLKIMGDLPAEYVEELDVHVNRVAHRVLYDHLCEKYEFTAFNG
jgi:hypothetical protein